MSVIELNFINRSNDTSSVDIVIFQRNSVPDFDRAAIAWKVIRNCGPLDNHPFDLPYALELSAEDSFGNFTPRLVAQPGQTLEMVDAQSGAQLVLANTPPNADGSVAIHNQLPQGAICAHAYKDNDELAVNTNIAPDQKASFIFKPELHIGAVTGVTQGSDIASDVLKQIKTVLDFSGLASADIVMTGGGAGPGAVPYAFHLENTT